MKTIKLPSRRNTTDKIKYALLFYFLLPYDKFITIIKKKIRKMIAQTNRYKQAVMADEICEILDGFTIHHNLYWDKYLSRIWNVNANYLENADEDFNI